MLYGTYLKVKAGYTESNIMDGKMEVVATVVKLTEIFLIKVLKTKQI